MKKSMLSLAIAAVLAFAPGTGFAASGKAKAATGKKVPATELVAKIDRRTAEAKREIAQIVKESTGAAKKRGLARLDALQQKLTNQRREVLDIVARPAYTAAERQQVQDRVSDSSDDIKPLFDSARAKLK